MMDRALAALLAGQFVEPVEQLPECLPGDHLLAVRLRDDRLPPAAPGPDHHAGVCLTKPGQAHDLFEFVGHQPSRRARMAVHRDHLPGCTDRATEQTLLVAGAGWGAGVQGRPLYIQEGSLVTTGRSAQPSTAGS